MKCEEKRMHKHFPSPGCSLGDLVLTLDDLHEIIDKAVASAPQSQEKAKKRWDGNVTEDCEAEPHTRKVLLGHQMKEVLQSIKINLWCTINGLSRAK